MKRVIGGLAACAVLMAAAPASAEAAPRTLVPCWGNSGGEYGLNWKVRPRECAFNGGEAHAFQTPIAEMTWRSWGGRTACGRGVFVYNSGYRARVRFCLYGKVLDGGVPVYSKIRGRFGTRWSAIDIDGRRIYGTRKPSRFDNSTW